jgi:hypothetical protein
MPLRWEIKVQTTECIAWGREKGGKKYLQNKGFGGSTVQVFSIQSAWEMRQGIGD